MEENKFKAGDKVKVTDTWFNNKKDSSIKILANKIYNKIGTVSNISSNSDIIFVKFEDETISSLFWITSIELISTISEDQLKEINNFDF